MTSEVTLAPVSARELELTSLPLEAAQDGFRFIQRLIRPTMEELRLDLRAVSLKCRPDWDITRPELKAEWAQGRKELFYPYGKSYAQTLGEQD